ncbi:MAG TPA: ABC transporter ATP-binding protein [Candidatus Saccharimonadales bacterium]|jgi:ATP-binding cassette subfamily B protein
MKSIWRIIKFTGELKRYYISVSVFTILIAAMTQVIPLLTKSAIDQIDNPGGLQQVDVRFVAIIAGLIFLTDIGTTIFSNIGGYFGDMLAAKQRRLLSRRYYAHVLGLPQQYFDRELTGTIINRMSRGIQQITDYTQVLSNNFLQFIFSTVFTLAIVAYFSWPVALMLASLYPVFIWLTARSSSTWQGYQKQINEDLDVASGRFAEGVSQIKVVKSFVREELELGFFDRFMRKVVKTTRPQSKFWHKQDVVRRSVLAVINFALYAFIFIQTARGTYSVSTMVLLILYTQQIRIPLFSISYLVDQSQRAISNTKDYFAVMDEPLEQVRETGAVPLNVTDGAVTFDDVTFSYSKGVSVLKHVSLTVRPNSKAALVGQSGEGKTTISSLLLGLYTADKGSVRIDGQDVSSVSQSSLRSAVAVVFQEPALFSGTIEENIAYGKPGATLAEITTAAKAANAHMFIEKLADGYQTEIGERGLRLSGGQKQRIAIARAILKDTPILVLDEATSSLDSRSEQLVQDALERLMEGRTTIIIAHRLSTIAHVDQIITLRGGRVDEAGSPAELEKTGGVYAQLLELQQLGASKAKDKKLKEFEMADA